MKPARLGLGLAIAVAGMPALAAPASLADCANIAPAEARLSCYDQLAAPFRSPPAQTSQAQPADSQPAAAAQGAPAAAPAPSQAQVPAPAPATPPATVIVVKAPEPSYLEKHWEIGAPNKRGTFQFRMHDINYIIAKYSDSPNNAPYQTIAQQVGGTNADLSHAELSFQLGFKMKAIEEGLPFKSDLWVAYTQKSFWQAANKRASSPFRETNYTPEAMVVTPLDFNLLGLRARFLNLGLVHQSNGQAASLSRSWNRVYAQLGVERGGFSLLARVWHRIKEPADTDDNPDITDYLGNGDLQATYMRNGHEYSLLTRYNPSTKRGAAQASWAFPLAGKLKGYTQIFSGYGQSLIDYNHRETTFGIGVQMNY